MTKRPYFTTPLFVLGSFLSLLCLVIFSNTDAYIQSLYANKLIESDSQHLRILSYRIAQENSVAANHQVTPESVRAIYLSSWVTGTPSLRNKLFEFVYGSDINAVVIDIKDSTGVISFPIKDNSILEKYGTDSRRISNIEEIIDELHLNDIYVIGRLTTFQDPALAKKYPHLAFKRKDNGQVWTDKKGLAFINPNNTEAWSYITELSKYSYRLGFDEINYDYIRYPSDGNISNINYDIESNETKASTLKKFYTHIDKEIRSKKITTSADIFGLVTTQKDDFGIGQILEDITPHFDFIAPMVYPSHYSAGFFNLRNPNAHPYEVITRSMGPAIERLELINQDPQKLRIWIQDFNLGTPSYGKSEIQAQIKAIYDLGLDSYMSWDPRNRYTKSAYQNILPL